MKVLTIKEPYASLIAEGIKKYEFRTWKTNYRGEFLVRVGKGVDRDACHKFSKYNLGYSKSQIIATIELVDCVEVNDEFRKRLRSENELVYSHVIEDTGWRGYAFVLKNVRKVEPIEVNGHLSFWNYDGKVILK